MIPNYFAFLLALTATGPLSYAVPTTALSFLLPDNNSVVEAGKRTLFLWTDINSDFELRSDPELDGLPSEGDLGIAPATPNSLPVTFYVLRRNVKFGTGRKGINITIPTDCLTGAWQAGFNISGDSGFYMGQPFLLENPYQS
ncbi:hypothetical protein JVU11DRAFT_8719 [Chiua virens]|nr:hypothetical protein JVU11DRAFT_8719 [Chiua virens]